MVNQTEADSTGTARRHPCLNAIRRQVFRLGGEVGVSAAVAVGKLDDECLL